MAPKFSALRPAGSSKGTAKAMPAAPAGNGDMVGRGTKRSLRDLTPTGGDDVGRGGNRGAKAAAKKRPAADSPADNVGDSPTHTGGRGRANALDQVRKLREMRLPSPIIRDRLRHSFSKNRLSQLLKQTRPAAGAVEAAPASNQFAKESPIEDAAPAFTDAEIKEFCDLYGAMTSDGKLCHNRNATTKIMQTDYTKFGALLAASGLEPHKPGRRATDQVETFPAAVLEKFRKLYEAKNPATGERAYDRAAIMKAMRKDFHKYSALIKQSGATARRDSNRDETFPAAVLDKFRKLYESRDPATGEWAHDRAAIMKKMGKDKDKYIATITKPGAARRSAGAHSLQVTAAEHAIDSGKPKQIDAIAWEAWVRNWCVDGLSRVCGHCGVLSPEHHRRRLVAVENIPACMQMLLCDGDDDVHICDKCYELLTSTSKQESEPHRTAVSRDAVVTAATPPELGELTPAERRLLALIEINVVMVHMPKGGTSAQKGGTYVAPLEQPRACDLFAQDEFLNVVDGVLYYRPRGMASEMAVPVRAAKLLTAFEYLIRTNPLYTATLVLTRKMKSAEARLRKLVARNTFNAEAEADAQAQVNADTVYFTQGGPAPVGATVQGLAKLQHSAAITPQLEPQIFPWLSQTAKGRALKSWHFPAMHGDGYLISTQSSNRIQITHSIS